MRKMRKWTGVALAMVCIVALVCVACAPATETPIEKEKAIKIGLGVPLTGAAASSGYPMAEGTISYLKYINDDFGGIEYRDPVSGETEKARLDIMVGDTQFAVAATVTNYKRQQGAGAKAMIIAGASPVEAVANMAIRDQMPIVAQGGCMTRGLLELTPKYWTMASPETAGHVVPAMQLISETWTEARNPRIALMIADQPNSRGSFTEAVQGNIIPSYAEKLGVDVVAIEWHPFTVTDASVELTRLMKEEPDYIYLSSGALNSTVVVLKDAFRLGFLDKVKIISWWGGSDESLLQLAPEESEGMYGLVWVSLPSEDLPGIQLAHRNMQKYYGHDATTNNIVGLVSAPAMVEGLKIALEEVGYENLTGAAINDGLHSIKDLDTGGIWPLITVDPDHPVLVKSLRHFIIENGTIKPVGEWYEGPSFINEEFGF